MLMWMRLALTLLPAPLSAISIQGPDQPKIGEKTARRFSYRRIVSAEVGVANTPTSATSGSRSMLPRPATDPRRKLTVLPELGQLSIPQHGNRTHRSTHTAIESLTAPDAHKSGRSGDRDSSAI